jgi:hypothetical protein
MINKQLHKAGHSSTPSKKVASAKNAQKKRQVHKAQAPKSAGSLYGHENPKKISNMTKVVTPQVYQSEILSSFRSVSGSGGLKRIRYQTTDYIDYEGGDKTWKHLAIRPLSLPGVNGGDGSRSNVVFRSLTVQALQSSLTASSSSAKSTVMVLSGTPIKAPESSDTFGTLFSSASTFLAPSNDPKWKTINTINFTKAYKMGYELRTLDAKEGARGTEVFAVSVIDPDNGAVSATVLQFRYTLHYEVVLDTSFTMSVAFPSTDHPLLDPSSEEWAYADTICFTNVNGIAS